MARSKSDQIYVELIEKIASGSLKRGDRLPTQKELASEFDCSVAPVKQALARLSLEGVTTSSTAGTFVATAEPALAGNLLSTYALVQQAPESFGKDYEERITRAERVEVEGRPAEMLGLPDGELVIRRDRQRFVGATAITMSTAWIPWKLGRHLAHLLVPETAPGMEAIEEANDMKTARLEEWVKADSASVEQAEFFGVDEGSPIKVVDHLWIAEDETPMVYGSGVHRAGEWSRYWVEVDHGKL